MATENNGEGVVIPVDPGFAAKANISSLTEYEAMYKRSIEDPEGFWAETAEEPSTGSRSGTRSSSGTSTVPHDRVVQGGKLNVSYNCLDRHLEAGKGDKAAIIWEGDPGDTRTFTYQELHDEVCRFANVLKKHGVKKGDRVAIYLPMIPELRHRHARLRPHRRHPHASSSAASPPRPCATASTTATAKVLITRRQGLSRRQDDAACKTNADEAVAECRRPSRRSSSSSASTATCP